MKNISRNILYVLFIVIFVSCTNTIKEEFIYNYEVKQKLYKNLEFVFVPQGNYTHGVFNEIKNINYDYWIMKYEVTNQQYYDFLVEAIDKNKLYVQKDTIYINYLGDNLKYKGQTLRPKGQYVAKILDDRIYYKDHTLYLDSNFANHPVIEVTWFGATAFCQYYGFQLPDKFEWEKAARGMTGWNYPWGDTLEFNRANFHNSGDPFDNGTTPVGFYNGQNYNGYQTKDSPSPYGCYDMAGNAWEYTNTILLENLAVYNGGGGGYWYHTGAMCKSNYFSTFGYGCYPVKIDRPFKSDGFRCIIK